MLYASIDIETTGLDRTKCQVLEIGVAIDDLTKPTEKPITFELRILHPAYYWEPVAYRMNKALFDEMVQVNETCFRENISYVSPSQAGTMLQSFLISGGLEMPCTVAGKNFNIFDLPFLENLPSFPKKMFRYRTIDPAFDYWLPGDKVLPAMDLCYKRAGIDKPVSHRALDDALGVVELVRRRFQFRQPD